MRRMRLGLPGGVALGVLVAATLAACSSDGNDSTPAILSATPNPLVSAASGGLGRATGGLRYDVAQYGYEEREYFFEGTATTYPPEDLPPARYRSRMIVWTPKDPARFNGTTVVEWAHVSVGALELTFELNAQSHMLVEQGFAFALVSAQEGGVCSKGPDGCSAFSLRGVDPERYEALSHPGEAYSFDIFNQALQAIKYPNGTAPLGALDTRFIIAEGFQFQLDRSTPVGDPSLSLPVFGVAGPLNAYLANGAAEADLVDALLIDSAAPLVEPTHYPVPTLHHLDESAIRRAPAPNGPNHVTWEVVGAPHVDRWAADHSRPPTPGEARPLLSREDEEARRASFENYGQVPDPRGEICAPTATLGTLFPRHYTLQAAVAALREWLETGIAPPAPPHAERVGPAPIAANLSLSRDGDGHAIGGLRLPIIEVPVASYNGETCVVGGTTTPFSAQRLAELYPTHQSYVEQLQVATDEAVASRILLCRDAQKIMRNASASTIGGDDVFTAAPACVR